MRSIGGSRLLLLLTLAACGQPRATDEVELRAVLDGWRAERAAAGAEVPGAILGLRRIDGDGDVTVVASGLADRERGRPMEAGDAFYLGSITKTFVAALALQLADDGRLALDAPVARWLPGVPNAETLTARHLLGHRSGLVDVYGYIYFRPERDEMLELVNRQWTRDELLALATRFEPRFAPASDWAYSSTNYLLLGLLIERLTGEELTAVLDRRLLAPLGLDATWLSHWQPPRKPLEVIGHMGTLPFWSHSEAFGTRGVPGPTTALERGNVEWAAGGLVSTADDALTFLTTLFGDRLLSPAARAAMTDFVACPPLGLSDLGTPPDDLENGYGLGLAKMVRPGGYTFIGHGGAYSGHTAGLWYLPACRTAVALYANRAFAGTRDLLDAVAKRVCDRGDR